MSDQVKLGIELQHAREDPTLRSGNLDFSAGSQLRGSVVVDVRRPVRLSNCLVTLTLLGQEQTSVLLTTSTNRVFRECRIFYRSECTLPQTTSLTMQHSLPLLDKGMHVLPFSISIPWDLPSSAHHGKLADGCLVQYLLCCSVSSQRSFRYFRIKARPPWDSPTTPAPLVVEPRSVPISLMGVKPVGRLAYGAKCDNTHVRKGDVVRVALTCRNQTTKRLQRVDWKLMELYSWVAHQEVSRGKRVLLCHNDDMDNVVVPNLPGLQCDKVGTRQTTEEIVVDEAGMIQDLEQPENVLHIPIPESAQESHTGTNVKISHYVKVYFRTEALVSNVTIKIPLQISAAEVDDDNEGNGAPSGDDRIFTRIVDGDDESVPFADAVALSDDEIDDNDVDMTICYEQENEDMNANVESVTPSGTVPVDVLNCTQVAVPTPRSLVPTPMEPIHDDRRA